jgi:uncharacterized protein involved in type VI secretion and phage assembly
MSDRMRQLFDPQLPGFHYGGYLAEVVSLNDPDSLSRVQVRILSCDGATDHDSPIWARVASPFAGRNRGAFLIPDVGDEVFVVFVNGDSRFPIIVGGLWNGSSTSPEKISGGKNVKKVIRSKNGVKITMEDKDRKEKFIVETPGGQKVTLKDGPGAITVEDSNGNSIKLETSGITVTASGKVTVNAAQVKVTAGTVKVDSALADFSGVVKCTTLRATTVVSTTYTPGAGNIW